MVHYGGKWIQMSFNNWLGNSDFDRDKNYYFGEMPSQVFVTEEFFYATDFPRVCGRTSELVIGQLITLSMCEGHILFL